MPVVELTSNIIEDFIEQQPVVAVLYFAPNDLGINEIRQQMSAVACTFADTVAFGTVDLAADANSELLARNVVVLTPTLIYYRFGIPWGEDMGRDRILSRLDHAYIVHCYGHTDTWLKMCR